MCAGPVVATCITMAGPDRCGTWPQSLQLHIREESWSKETERERHTHTEEGSVGKEMIEGMFQLTYSARRGTSQRARRVASRVGGAGVATVARVVASRAH